MTVHTTILNDWLEIIDDGNSVCLSWDKHHTKEEAYELHKLFLQYINK